MAEEDQEQPHPPAVAVEAAQNRPNQLVSEADEDWEIRNESSSSSLKLKIPIKKPTAAAEADDHQFMEEDLLLRQELEQDQQQRGEVLGLLRTCSECGKQFPSGKALGGHKRACLQKIKNGTNHNNQKPRLIKNAVAMKLEETGEESRDNNHICYVCHQSFRSVKSLYGHMRKHPEREWRGVQPPKHYLLSHRHQNLSPSSSPTIHYPLSRDNHDHDHYDDDGYYDVDGSMGSGAEELVESLKGWSAKRKRGQRLIMSSSSDEDEDVDEAMQQAVSDLLLLAQLSADDCNDNKMQRGTFDHHQVVSSVGSGYGVLKIKDNKKIDDDRVEDDDSEKKKVNVEVKDDNGLGFDNCNSEDTWIVKEDYEGDEDAGSSEMDDQMLMVMMMKQQKKNKRRKLNELDDAVLEGTTAGPGALKDAEEPVGMSTAQTYSCPICNKSFDKHQALGGHVASHNKNKNVKECSSASATAATEDGKAEDKLAAAAAAAASDEETGESSKVLAAAAAAAGGGSSEHKCNICNKIFPSGQALGGHKRCHWTGPAEAFSSSSQVTTSAGEVTQTAPSPCRVVHDFDLNDTPPEYYQFHGGEAAAPSAAAATISQFN